METRGNLPTAALEARIATARDILAVKQNVASAVTDEFFRRHPDSVVRYGPHGRERAIQDASHHLDFLAGAIEAGSVAAFCDYSRWCSRVVSRYGIAPQFLAENFSQIEAALTQRLTASRAELVVPFVRAAVACLDTNDSVATTAASPLDATRAVFVQTILSGRRKEAVRIASDALRAGTSITDLYSGVFQAALYEIGEGWETGRLTVAQEHMATATVQYVLAQIYARLPLPERTCGNAIVTGVEGELHQVGANIVADILESNGWNVRFLGTNMPHRDIVAAIEEHEATLVGISATMLFNLPRVRSLIEDIRGTLRVCAPRIVVGGGAFRSCASFSEELGVDGPGRDVADALRLSAA